jgi:hypothetical protein
LKAFNKREIPSNPFTLATFLISPNYLPPDSRCPHFVIENLPGINSILPHTQKKKKKTYKEVTSKFPLLSPEQRIPLHTEKQGLPSQLLNTLGSPTPFLNASKASAAKKDNR